MVKKRSKPRFYIIVHGSPMLTPKRSGYGSTPTYVNTRAKAKQLANGYNRAMTKTGYATPIAKVTTIRPKQKMMRVGYSSIPQKTWVVASRKKKARRGGRIHWMYG